MEQTFMTIHNLSRDAHILFASDSVVDVLGYQPQEIRGKSSFEYFDPDEVHLARSIHNRGVLLDQAAVLHRARILSKDGRFVSCECCFTIVYDVLVACISVHHRGKKSERRAIEAPHIRKIFSSSPRDPRYHMLEYLSPKFKMQPTERESRAALILNRFTRTLTIMFATNTVSSVLGIDSDRLKGRSLYEWIAENCWGDAIKCLEDAKANNSIAYLRFWSRDPQAEDISPGDRDNMGMGSPDDTSVNNSDSSVVIKHITNVPMTGEQSRMAERGTDRRPPRYQPMHVDKVYAEAHGATSTSHLKTTRNRDSPRPMTQGESQARCREPTPSCELEAVITCSSDGLVMVLRKARPPIPSLRVSNVENSLFTGSRNVHLLGPNHPANLLHTFDPASYSNTRLHERMPNQVGH
ncbi:hypothetical protein F4808DRAFT_356549 [Astrocystis sublimbata]|nr:hypothetical protein F4808DRAFT_356549 [Astrocystis sublimbata]